MHRFFMLIALVAAGAGACATTSQDPAPPRAPDPTSNVPDPHAPGHAADGRINEDVRKMAAEQLQCALEQVTVICTRTDRTGECIAVRAIGCDREFQYEFGTE